MDGTQAALATARRLLAAAIVVVAAGVALAALTPLAPGDGARGLAVRALPLLVPVAGLLELAAAGFAATSLRRARGTDALAAVRRPAVVVLTVAVALVVLIPVQVFAAILLAAIVDTAAT
jgi:hypothetical protein